MGNIFNDDFQDFIKALNDHKVDYILVGGYSVILHGYPRTTGDLDIWVKKNRLNYAKLLNAFEQFGLSLFDMTLDNFLNNDSIDVFTFGRAPVAIDLMTSVKGLDFDKCFVDSKMVNVDNLHVRLIQYKHLIVAKHAAGRHKDMDDIENLQDKNQSRS